MKPKNNNQRILWTLALNSYKNHKRRNLLLVIALTISVVLIYSAFTISKSKIQTDFLIEVRRTETAATVKIDHGSENQVNQLKKLPYIKQVGVEKSISTVEYANVPVGQLIYQDLGTFQNFTVPAISNISGKYPETTNEVMVSEKFLQQIEKRDSHIGDILALSLTDEPITEFKISGIYKSYGDPSVGLSKIFVPKKYLLSKKIDLYPTTNILITQASSLDGEYIETQLYKDLEMNSDTQQIVGQTSFYTQAIDQTFGSYQIAILVGIIVFFTIYLFIYNVLSISLDSDLREMGLLKTLGTTNRQLDRIQFYQLLINGTLGVVIGGILSLVFSLTILPKLIERLYLTGFGSFPQQAPISLDFLLLSICLSLTILFFSMFQANRKIKKLPPKSVINYGAINRHGSEINNIGMHSIPLSLAWRSIMSSKKRFLITVASLTVGVLVGIGTIIIINGTDVINEIKQNEDFGIVNLLTPDDLSDPEMMMENLFIPNDIVSKIKSLRQLEGQKTETVQGNYVKIDLQNERALKPRFLSNKQADHNSKYATLQILDSSSILKLVDYIEKIDYPADLSSFKNGDGVLMLHYHRLSKKLDEAAIKEIGKPINFYSLSGKTFSKSDQIGSVSNAGYLDVTKKQFPDIPLGYNGPTINYFIISEQGFNKLGLTKQTMSMKLWSKPNQNPKLQKKITELVYAGNKQLGENEPLFLASNEERLKDEIANSKSTQTIMATFSLALISVGLISFFNTIQMNYLTSKKEVDLLKTLGMTRSQIRKKNLAEGLIYWVFFIILLLVIGIPSLLSLKQVMTSQINYFKFEFPADIFIITIILMLLICLSGVDLNSRLKK